MSRVINAIFEDGVFKPLQKVDMQEHEKVSLKVIDLADWQARFDRIIAKIHHKAAQYSSQEIESDMHQAVVEVREEKRGH